MSDTPLPPSLPEPEPESNAVQPAAPLGALFSTGTAVESGPPPLPGQPRQQSVWLGIVLVPALHIGVLGTLAILYAPLAGMAVIGLGIAQLIYIIPAVIIARSKGQPAVAKGLIIGAGLTLLLNGMCFGILLLSLGSGSFR